MNTKAKAKKEEVPRDKRSKKDEENEIPKLLATPMNELSAAEEMEACKKGLEDPEIVMHVDKGKLVDMTEMEVKDYLAERLTKYLLAHYGMFAPKLLELVLKKNNLGILHLITVAGELAKFAKENGFIIHRERSGDPIPWHRI